MIRKSDIVREAVRSQDWKKALRIAKDFQIGISKEQREKMSRAYECIVHPDFYRQIGTDIQGAIEEGKKVVKEYAESRRENSMKWDVKHDRAKKVIDHFLDNAGYWQEVDNLSEGLTEEEKELVAEEVELMIASIRKRYKLDVRLDNTSEKAVEPQATIKTEEVEDKATQEEKPKRGRKPTGEKKATARKPRVKKADKEAETA